MLYHLKGIGFIVLKLSLVKMKLSPAISLDKKCRSYQDNQSPTVHVGSSNCYPEDADPTHTVIAEEPGECRRQPRPLLRVNRETGFDPWWLWCILKGWTQCFQQLASSCTQRTKFLHPYLDLNVQTACCLCASLYIAWLPLQPPWAVFSWATEILSPGLES